MSLGMKAPEEVHKKSQIHFPADFINIENEWNYITIIKQINLRSQLKLAY